MEPGGIAIITKPYHGYWKNLALALTGRMDACFKDLWDHGNIKFWSIKTLRNVLTSVGFVDVGFERIGKSPILSKSIMAIAKKP